jgi:epoxide hydrolase
MSSSDVAIRPFRIEIAEAALQDLRERLARTRWPDELPNAGIDYGLPLSRARDLAEYWRTRYDWRKHEARLNEFPQFTTTIDGQNVHFLHVRSPRTDALPLIVTLGWPSSVAELLDIIGPLTNPSAHGGDASDAFHVVAPTIPGFGFSGPTRERGWNARRVAHAWATLMDRLGYQHYAAQGSDWGSIISPELGRIAPDHVVGVHVNALAMMPPKDPSALDGLSDAEKKRVAAQKEFTTQRLGYAQIQSTRPQTVAYALTDSPAGQLAWNVDLFDAFSSGANQTPIERDIMLTSVSIYWLTATAGSSARLYRESGAAAFDPKERSTVPTGVAVFPGDSAVRPFAERANTIVHWSEFHRGGHFAAVQAPDLLVQDVREFFRKRRQAPAG